MKVECLRQRPGGSEVEFPGVTYHFKPDGRGRHVAEVDDPAHLRRLLQIEAYQIAENMGGAPATTDDDMDDLPPAPAADTPPISAAPVTGEEDGGEGDPGEGQNGEGEGATEDAQTGETAEGLANLSDEELRKVFADRLGRQPHPKATRDTMIAKIEAETAKG